LVWYLSDLVTCVLPLSWLHKNKNKTLAIHDTARAAFYFCLRESPIVARWRTHLSRDEAWNASLVERTK
jgi:hypothetical protein